MPTRLEALGELEVVELAGQHVGRAVDVRVESALEQAFDRLFVRHDWRPIYAAAGCAVLLRPAARP